MTQGLTSLPVDVWWRILEDVVQQSAPFAGARCASLGGVDRRHREHTNQGGLWHLALASDKGRLRLADAVRFGNAQPVLDYTASLLAAGKGREIKQFYIEFHHRQMLRKLINVCYTARGGVRRGMMLPRRGSSGDAALGFIETASELTLKVKTDAIGQLLGVAPAVETRLRRLVGEEWWQLARHYLVVEGAACARRGQRVHCVSSSEEPFVISDDEDDEGDG